MIRGVAVDAVCPRCGEKAVPTGEPMLTCRACAMVFRPREEPSLVRTSTTAVELPAEMTREREGDTLRVLWPYDDAGQMLAAVLLLGVPFWLAAYFVPVWWALAIAAAIGVGGVYAFVARLIGKRILELGPETLTLRARPLPIRPGISVPRAAITEVGIRKVGLHRKGGPTVELFVRVRDAGDRVLVTVPDHASWPHAQLGPLRDLIAETYDL